ncbi:peroxisomal biogenesis factor 19 isoform X2 [Pectinophora gossypiella]|uniref:peroxisomal biogenesis factor 19 isoform X2 n=1 Tax=Pectinophora gossypiella TaxID=13191 RepID=UPI00214E666E|nr:peroxisomal biogenesis factor 19 isoform X2 [Pectinophora gossypiella]
MSDKKEMEKKDVDPELDDLLDSALQDMTKKPEDSAPGSEAVPQNMWSEEFIKEAAAQFESNMAAILGSFSGVPEDQISQDQIAQTFSKMAEAAAQVLKAPGDSASEPTEPTSDPAVKEKIDEVSAAISQTLQNLSSNAENLQTPFSDQDLANMFNSFSLGEGGQDGNMFVPFMQGMMQSLLSKEVLYPSLKELVDKYPAWLAENKGKIDAAEYDRFSKQQELMLKVCAELEPEQESDPEDVRRKRFETVLDLMQKMQDLGQPPTELVGDIAVPPQGFAPPTGQDPSQCSLM